LTGSINLSLFTIGGYPPSFNLSTLSPSQPSLEPNSQVTKTKFINSEAMEQARQALTIVKQAPKHPGIKKQLLLSMALVRTNPRMPPSYYPANGMILTDRFCWPLFTPLDRIICKSMHWYYKLSTNK
jgi:hypothetical protein